MPVEYRQTVAAGYGSGVGLLAQITLLFFVLAIAHAATAQSNQLACDAALDTMKFKWKDPEEWAWSELCRGRTANFDSFLDENLIVTPNGADSTQSNDARPYQNPSVDTTGRRLGSKFLRSIMTDPILHELLPDSRIRIHGAFFPAGVDLDDALLRHDIQIRNSVIKRNLDMRNVRALESISLVGIVSTRTLDVEGMEIDGDIEVRSSTFRRFDMESAVVREAVNLRKSTFVGSVNLDRLDVGGDLDIHASSFASVRLGKAEIGGDIDIKYSMVKGRVDMGGTTTQGRLHIRDTILCKGVKVTSTAVGEDLSISNTAFATIDLSGAKIAMALDLENLRSSQQNENCSTSDKPAKPGEQAKPAKLILEDVKAGRLRDGMHTWPENLVLELDGFEYGRFETTEGDRESMADDRAPEWYTAWLERDVSPTAQPYLHLATVMGRAGRADVAGHVRSARLERIRAESTPHEFRWWLLSAFRITMGYGEGWANLLIFAWVGLLSLMGTVALRIRQEVDMYGEPLGFWYSLDMLVPVVQLDVRHYDTHLKTAARYYFMLHKVLGYVLVFLVATGLTAALTDVME